MKKRPSARKNHRPSAGNSRSAPPFGPKVVESISSTFPVPGSQDCSPGITDGPDFTAHGTYTTDDGEASPIGWGTLNIATSPPTTSTVPLNFGTQGSTLTWSCLFTDVNIPQDNTQMTLVVVLCQAGGQPEEIVISFSNQLPVAVGKLAMTTAGDQLSVSFTPGASAGFTSVYVAVDGDSTTQQQSNVTGGTLATVTLKSLTLADGNPHVVTIQPVFTVMKLGKATQVPGSPFTIATLELDTSS